MVLMRQIGPSPTTTCVASSATPFDQVPRVEAPSRSRALGDRPCRGGPDGGRPVHRDHPRGPGLQGAGAHVTAVDTARYAHVFARCYIETDARSVDSARAGAVLAGLDGLPGRPGYVTEVFCRQSRFFQPDNGARIDAIRDAIARDWAGSPIEPILLTSLIEAADRVDSTTGVQMAYVKQWADRSKQPLAASSAGAARWRRHGGAGRRGGGGTDAARPSTSRISIRPTTSTATPRTITCGRRWWRGTRHRTTASPASDPTFGIRRRARCSTRAEECRSR